MRDPNAAGPGNYKWLLGREVDRVFEALAEADTGEKATLRRVDMLVLGFMELASPHSHDDEIYLAELEALDEEGAVDPTRYLVRKWGVVWRSLHRQNVLTARQIGTDELDGFGWDDDP